MILNRKLILTAALSILVIGGMGATFALTAPPMAASVYSTTHSSTTCYALKDHKVIIVACKVDSTSTVTDSGTATCTTGDGAVCATTTTVTGTVTTTVTQTVTANETATGDGSTVTVTQTVTAAVAPFYDVYANGQEIGVCWTYAQYQAAISVYGTVAASPDAACHGVHN